MKIHERPEDNRSRLIKPSHFLDFIIKNDLIYCGKSIYFISLKVLNLSFKQSFKIIAKCFLLNYLISSIQFLGCYCEKLNHIKTNYRSEFSGQPVRESELPCIEEKLLLC
jgi:hypothetical protein